MNMWHFPIGPLKTAMADASLYRKLTRAAWEWCSACHPENIAINEGLEEDAGDKANSVCQQTPGLSKG